MLPQLFSQVVAHVNPLSGDLRSVFFEKQGLRDLNFQDKFHSGRLILVKCPFKMTLF